MARAFQFRLEAVRRLRSREQDAQRRVLADALRAVRRAEARIEKLNRDLQGSIDRSREDRMTASVDVYSLRGHQVYQSSVHRRLLEASRELTARRVVLDVARAALAEASKRHKAIEKLREKQWQRYTSAVRKEEQAAYDETSAVRHARLRGRQTFEDVAT